MVRKDSKRRLTGLLLLLCAAMPAFLLQARPQLRSEEDYVRLVKAKSIQIVTGDDDRTWRKATDATFLHNNTYLVCDTAVWNVDDNLIKAKGNVSLSQDGTTLTSETLDYIVDRNLAQFRGSVVQLVDDEGNTLRTKNLDYNTADSVAVFTDGGALKDKDGQIIESFEGTYDSKAGLFTFSRDVEMFTDSVFIKTTSLDYHTDSQRAVFPSEINFWKEDNMLSAQRGWYDRGQELFFFRDKVHALSPDHETWSDSLYFWRTLSNVELRGNVQLQDSVRRTSSVCGKLFYEDSLSRVTLTRKAAVAIATDGQNAQEPDTLYFGADTLIYYTLRRFEIPESAVKAAQDRLQEITTDPVGEYRRKAAQEAAKKAEEAARKKESEKAGRASVGGPAAKAGAPSQEEYTPAEAPVTSSAEDSTALSSEQAPTDTLSAPADSLFSQGDSLQVEVPDSTKVGFAIALRNVQIYRSDLQVKCDSLHYTDLDSIARFYIDPIIWNEGTRQYYSDSLNVLVRSQSVDRASLMGNAMIVTQEDSLLYDQIRGAEVLAYFDSSAALKRFDAIGGATALFYLEENGSFSTVNKVESKMLSGVFKDGTIDRVYYFDSPKNDAYPLAQFPSSERRFKGFRWNPELRPVGKSSITDLSVRPSSRSLYMAIPRPSYIRTEIYFPGYMQQVYRSLERAKLSQKEASQKKPSSPAPSDSAVLSVATDTLGIAKDSLLSAVSDSLAASKDSLSAVSDSTQTLSERRPSLIERIRAKIERFRERREARWALMDARDAAKAAEKEKKAVEKARQKKRSELKAIQEQNRRDEAKLQKYIEEYERKKAKNGKP